MKSFILLVFAILTLNLAAQQIIPLYPGVVPNSTSYKMKEIRLEKDGQFLGFKSISEPTLKVYLPDEKTATGAAVVICPGGGYSMECYPTEGTIIAEAFVKKGIAAFVLKYRLPSDSIMPEKSVGPLQDAQQGIKTVRQRAAEWKINPNKVGIMGFSAGGHLASTAGTHFERPYIPNDEKINLRPDFMILIYPVISMQEGLTHRGSRNNLLGKSPSEEQITLFSNDLQVTANTPPTWITHTGDDTVVPVENSIRFYQQLIRNKVPAEMILYPSGNHGFIKTLPADQWMQPLFEWMAKSGITK